MIKCENGKEKFVNKEMTFLSFLLIFVFQSFSNLRIFLVDAGEDGEEFATFFIIRLYLLPWYPSQVSYDFKPVLSFARFTLANL